MLAISARVIQVRSRFRAKSGRSFHMVDQSGNSTSTANCQARIAHSEIISVKLKVAHKIASCQRNLTAVISRQMLTIINAMTIAIHVDGFCRLIAMASQIPLPNKTDNKQALAAVRALLCVGQLKGKRDNLMGAVEKRRCEQRGQHDATAIWR